MSNSASVDETVRQFAVAVSNMITAITAAETSRRVAEYRKVLGEVTAKAAITGNGTPDEPLLLNVRQAAKTLGISVRTLSKYSVPWGPIPVVKIGARTCYHLEDLKAAIERMKERK